MPKKNNNKTTKLQSLAKKLKAAVHLSQRYTQYYKDNKEEYRELLQKHFNVNSSSKLSIDQLIALLDYLNFKTDEIKTKKQNKASPAQVATIKKLWAQYARDKSDRALIHFLSKYNNSTLALKVEYYPSQALQKGIIALKKTIARSANAKQ